MGVTHLCSGRCMCRQLLVVNEHRQLVCGLGTHTRQAHTTPLACRLIHHARTSGPSSTPRTSKSTATSLGTGAVKSDSRVSSSFVWCVSGTHNPHSAAETRPRWRERTKKLTNKPRTTRRKGTARRGSRYVLVERTSSTSSCSNLTREYGIVKEARHCTTTHTERMLLCTQHRTVYHAMQATT